jgi:hypothetical protein
LILMESSMVLEGWDLLTKHADKTVSVGWLNFLTAHDHSRELYNQ